MKEGWEVKKLGEVCDVLNGFAFKSDKYVDNGVRVIRITNVQHGYIEDNDPKFYPVDECYRLGQYMLKEHDLLMSLTGNVGRVGLLDGKYLPAALNQRVACLRIKDNSVELKYIFHHLNSELFETRCIQSAKGIAQKNMSTEWLKEYSIPIPPLEEQSRIVEELDQLSNIIEKKRQQLNELDNLSQSIFYDMFGDPVTNEKGWEVKKYRDFGKVIGGYAFASDSFSEKGIPVLKIGNINSGNLKTEKICFYEYDESLSNYFVFPNDIVISLTGTVGKDDYGNVCILPDIYDVYYLNQRNAKLDAKGICLNLFLKFLFADSKIKTELTKNSRGVRQANISNNDIYNLRLILPPLEFQQLFAQKIEAIEKEKELIKQSIKETEELFNSRMDYYFG